MVHRAASGQSRHKAAIASIEEGAWTTIEYTDAIRDEATGKWISRSARVTPIECVGHSVLVAARMSRAVSVRRSAAVC
ncbi:hypothetical protein BA895_18745 [Humibacillus sp. DSM 29435]|nr:hypothetical protein BA895_18745 [Humibacillus sp. DSM 29435]